MLNTAQLRNMAREAESRLDWRAAADLYQQAHDAYPCTQPVFGTLADKDKEYLRSMASSCRTMVVHTEKLCDA
jgi:hypothetical protein